MKIGQARLSTIAPVQRCILLEPGGWPRSAKCSSAVPEAQPAGRGKVCKGPRQDVRCLHRDDLAAADSRCLSRFSVPLLPKPRMAEVRGKGATATVQVGEVVVLVEDVDGIKAGHEGRIMSLRDKM